jgi:GxxExxY protein
LDPQQSLEVELQIPGIPFCSNHELHARYKQRELKKRYILDFVVFGKLILELNAASAQTVEHEGRPMDYIRISKSPVGYLINFGPFRKLEYRRFVLSEFLCVHSGLFLPLLDANGIADQRH